MDISYLKTVFSSISSGVIGGCMVSFFIGQPTLKEFIWIVLRRMHLATQMHKHLAS